MDEECLPFRCKFQLQRGIADVPDSCQGECSFSRIEKGETSFVATVPEVKVQMDRFQITVTGVWMFCCFTLNGFLLRSYFVRCTHVSSNYCRDGGMTSLILYSWKHGNTPF